MNHVSFLVSDGIAAVSRQTWVCTHCLRWPGAASAGRGHLPPWDAFSQSVSQLRIAPL